MRISDGSSDVCSSELLFEACLERMAVVERAGLVRRPGAELRIPTAGCEIGVPFLLTDFFHRTRSEEPTSELQLLMRISYAAFCLIKKIPSICQLLIL